MAHKNELHQQKGDDVEGGAENTQGLAEVRENRKFVKSKVFVETVYYQMFVVCADFWLLVASLVGA